MYRAIETTTTLLKYTFGFVFLIAGLDKITNYITNWTHYLWGFLAELSGLDPTTFMLVVGAFEVFAGVLILFKPVIGSYTIMSWLILISITLIAKGEYYDVAVRDIVMSVSVFCLALLSKELYSGKQQPTKDQ